VEIFGVRKLESLGYQWGSLRGSMFSRFATYRRVTDTRIRTHARTHTYDDDDIMPCHSTASRSKISQSF